MKLNSMYVPAAMTGRKKCVIGYTAHETNMSMRSKRMMMPLLNRVRYQSVADRPVSSNS